MTNPRMASDLTVGVSLARAATEGALANVEINLGDIKDEGFVADVKRSGGGNATEWIEIPG